MDAHQHHWEERDGTVMLSTGRPAMQLQHACACGDWGVGPADWCEQERQHNHSYEPLPTIAKVAQSRPVSAGFRVLNFFRRLR
jgi:hypothetical protein